MKLTSNRRLAALRRWYIAHVRHHDYSQPMAAEQQSCANCGHTYVGNYCPACGQKASVPEVGVKFATQRMLEAWGLDNSKLLATLWQLLYRPGYMIGDYLRGHRVAVFTPVKMAILTLAGYFFVIWLTGADVSILHSRAHSGISPDDPDRFWVWINQHNATALLLLHFSMALATRLFFGHPPRIPRCSLAKHFVAQVFVMSQLLVVSGLLILLLQGRVEFANYYYMPIPVTVLLLLVDFKQLYGYRLWGTLWRTLASLAMSFAVFIFVISSLGLLVEKMQ